MNAGTVSADQAPGPQGEQGALLQAFRVATAGDLETLALFHDREPDAVWLQALRTTDLHHDLLGLRLTSRGATEALEVLEAAISALPEPVDSAGLDELAADFADIYLVNAIQAAPCESVWFDDENLNCQDSMFQVRECYARHGLAAANWRVRPDDHLVIQLQFLAHLFGTGEGDEQLREAARFMDEHMLRWLTRFAERVAARCRTPYFAGVAMLSAAYCEELRNLLAELLGEPRPSRKEIEMRMRPRREVIPAVPLKFMPGMGPGW